MFINNILSGQVACPEITDVVYLYNPPRELKRNRIFDDIFHRTNYTLNEPITRCLKFCNDISSIINFNVNKYRLKLNLFILYN